MTCRYLVALSVITVLSTIWIVLRNGMKDRSGVRARYVYRTLTPRLSAGTTLLRAQAAQPTAPVGEKSSASPSMTGPAFGV